QSIAVPWRLVPWFSASRFFLLPPPTDLYTLSLHDALPISTIPSTRVSRWVPTTRRDRRSRRRDGKRCGRAASGRPSRASRSARRSEEHTSELQSRENLVCRLLLEKKKQNNQKKHNERNEK